MAIVEINVVDSETFQAFGTGLLDIFWIASNAYAVRSRIPDYSKLGSKEDLQKYQCTLSLKACSIAILDLIA